jgi:hypothetical protein
VQAGRLIGTLTDTSSRGMMLAGPDVGVSHRCCQNRVIHNPKGRSGGLYNDYKLGTAFFLLVIVSIDKY